MDLEKQYTKTDVTNPFAICDLFINNPESAYVVGKKWKEQLNNTVKTMFECVEKIDKGESLGAFSYQPIEECLNFLNSITVEKLNTKDLTEFIKAYIFLAHNVNQNTEKYDGVTRKIAYLQRYCDGALTFSETISLLKITSQRLYRWREWTPPSFRLSTHYYNLLKEE